MGIALRRKVQSAADFAQEFRRFSGKQRSSGMRPGPSDFPAVIV
jgi:hypothetical protein